MRAVFFLFVFFREFFNSTVVQITRHRPVETLGSTAACVTAVLSAGSGFVGTAVCTSVW